jgi:DNA-binding transcriptional ArsR family regulator
VTGSETITSTVSFHLKELKSAGLITMDKRGKYMSCDINRDAVALLAGYFKQASERSGCCQGENK